MTEPTIGAALPLEVEAAEERYTTWTRQAKDHPERWGEAEEAEAERLADELRAAYEKHNTPEIDRQMGV